MNTYEIFTIFQKAADEMYDKKVRHLDVKHDSERKALLADKLGDEIKEEDEQKKQELKDAKQDEASQEKRKKELQKQLAPPYGSLGGVPGAAVSAFGEPSAVAEYQKMASAAKSIQEQLVDYMRKC